MAKFIFLYNGPATPMEDMTEEHGKEVMEKWNVWIEKLGSSLVDVGTPMENGESVVDNGSTSGVLPLSGYSIVEAGDIAGAKKFAQDHPFLTDSDGKFKTEIFELMPVPM